MKHFQRFVGMLKYAGVEQHAGQRGSPTEHTSSLRPQILEPRHTATYKATNVQPFCDDGPSGELQLLEFRW